MSKILLLHDLKEKDLARDLKDLLETIGAEIYTIPLSPNLGSTLEDKENHYIQQSDGAIFLITPGAVRTGGTYPSPSVSVEIGQIKERFKSKPGHIIYLQEDGCASPTIHQQAFIGFNRKDIRSIIEALTCLIRDLKESGLLVEPVVEVQRPKDKPIDKEGLAESLKEEEKWVLLYLLQTKRKYMVRENLAGIYKRKRTKTDADFNILENQLKQLNLIRGAVGLSPLGEDVAAIIYKKTPQASDSNLYRRVD